MIPLFLGPFTKTAVDKIRRDVGPTELFRSENLLVKQGVASMFPGWAKVSGTPIASLTTWNDLTGQWNLQAGTWHQQGTVGGAIRHIAEHVKLDGTHYICIHTNKNFVVFDPTSGTLYDLTKVGGYASSEFWSSASYGDGYIFTNGSDNIQLWNGNTATVAADLGGTPPKCVVVRVVGPYLMLFNTANDKREVRWCTPGAPTDWTSAGSGFLILYDGEGSISTAELLTQNIVAVWKEKSIHSLSMTDFPYTFTQQSVVHGVGTTALRGVSKVGSTQIALTNRGLQVYDGVQVRPFDNQIQRLMGDYFPNKFASYAQVLNEKAMSRLWVLLPAPNSGTKLLDRAWVYDFIEQTWLPQTVMGVYSAGFATAPAALSNWDALGGTWDSYREAWDSRLSESTEIMLFGDESGYLNRLDPGGFTRQVSYEALLETGLYHPGAMLFDSRHVGAELVQIDVGLNNGSVQVQVGTCENADERISWSVPLTPDASGHIYRTITGRWFTFRIRSTAAFELSNLHVWFVKRGTL